MRNKSDITKVREVVEAFGIDRKSTVDSGDAKRVAETLMGQGDIDLSLYISNLSDYEFEDLIVNTIYG